MIYSVSLIHDDDCASPREAVEAFLLWLMNTDERDRTYCVEDEQGNAVLVRPDDPDDMALTREDRDDG